MSDKEPQLFYSQSGKREKKGYKKDTKLGWYAFLYFLFLLSYAYFSFVYFK